MKKTILFGIICLMTGGLTLSTTQTNAQKKEEDAIKKVIQEETSDYFHKNYDAWANTWVHDTATSLLRASTDSYEQLLGWNAISSEYKQDIQNLSVKTDAEIAPYLNKTDYHFYVNGNVATVSFKEDDQQKNTEMRTMVKQNGDWKILNFTIINTSTYDMNRVMGNMRSFVGTWVKDGEATMEPSNGGVLNSAKFILKEMPTGGFEQLSDFIFTNKSGQSFAPPYEPEYFIPDYNTGTISYTSVRKNRFGQTFVSSGKVSSDKANSFTVTEMYPDTKDAIESEYTVTLQNGKWHQVGKSFDRTGKQTSTSTLELSRQ